MGILKKNKGNIIVIVTHANIILGAVFYWMQNDVLPLLISELNVDAALFGFFQALLVIVQIFGGPIFGRFGDLYGNRTALSIVFLSSFFNYFFLAITNSVFLLYLSRVPLIFTHAVQGAQMVVTDLTEPKKRSEKLGKLGFSYGLGMALGPIISHWIAQHTNEQKAAFIAAIGSLLNVALIYLIIPVHTKIPTKGNIRKIQNAQKLFDFGLFWRLVWRNPEARYLLIMRAISGLPIDVLRSMFGVIRENYLRTSSEESGLILLYMGILSMITQGFLIGRLTRLGYSNWSIINASVIILAVSYAALAIFAVDTISFCIIVFPLVGAGTVFSVVLQSMLTNTTPYDDTGTILGFNMAVQSLIRSISPALGYFLFHHFGFPLFGGLGFICNLLLYLYIGTAKGMFY